MLVFHRNIASNYYNFTILDTEEYVRYYYRENLFETMSYNVDKPLKVLYHFPRDIGTRYLIYEFYSAGTTFILINTYTCILTTCAEKRYYKINKI